MAQLDKHNRLIGGLGDLVFRQIDGKTIVQLKPGKDGVKQTKRAKLSASDFGTASRTTKSLTVPLRRLFLTYYDSQMFNRFRKAVYQAMLRNTDIPKGEKDLWEGELSLIDGFEFNLSSLYSDYCHLEVTVSLTPTQAIKIETSEFNPQTQLRWPKKIYRAEVCYLLTVYDKDTYKPLQREVFQIEVERTASTIAPQSYITPSLPLNSLAVVSSCVWFFEERAVVDRTTINHKGLHPAKILTVLKLEN